MNCRDVQFSWRLLFFNPLTTSFGVLAALVLGTVVALLFVAVGLLFILLFFLAWPGLGVDDIEPFLQREGGTFLLLISFSFQLALLAYVIIAVWLSPDISWRDLGMHLDRWYLWIPVGVATFLVGGGLVFLLITLGFDTDADILVDIGIRRNPFGIIVTLAVVGVFGPILEEIYFRGAVLMAGMKAMKKVGLPHAFLFMLPFSAGLFAVIHGIPEILLPIFAMALVFGGITYWTKSLIPAITAHIINNTIAVIAFLLI